MPFNFPRHKQLPGNMGEFRQRFSLPAFFLTCSLIIHAIYAAKDRLIIGQTIRDGETLVSSGGICELGFFTPGSSGNWYIAIRYHFFDAAIWIANRQAPTPLKNKSGVLQFTQAGRLVLLNDTGGIIWSSTTSRSVKNPVAQLLDSGNLVVRDANDDRPENFLWQSFDYPSDTYLPGMKIGWNFVTGVETYLSSWTSNDDPAPGEYTLHLDPTGFPQIVLKRDKDVLYRAAPLNGLLQPSGPQDSTSRLTLQMNKYEAYCREDPFNGSALWRSRLSQSGISQRFAWSSLSKDWFLYRSAPNPGDACDDTYNLCGAYGSCNTGNSPVCGCLDKFVPKDPQGLLRGNGSTGCIRRTPLINCNRTDAFLKYPGIKLPDTQNSSFNDRSTINIEECREECLRNCSCMAYTQLDDVEWEGGRGCLLYYGDLIDIKNMSQGGQDLYIRMDSSELENVADESKGNNRVILIASLTSGVGAVLLILGLSLILYIRKWKNDPSMRKEGSYNESQGKDSELPLFELSTILKATDHFSINNRIGEGGFGPVYRGMLDDGEEVAVKRLSKTSAQGFDELKNEVILIAKLQHRNLVRLLGCCVEGEENMLIYEYMPNKSLDLILFDQTKSMLLDWRKCFNIINGIAKGLLYLHQDSRLRIIHRDLKASNILLDSDMNPRISDFGLARIFGGNETSEVQTHTVVGTYGYMSPEYEAEGLFSLKSDIFSFGVLVLEIVSGKRNRGFSLGDHYLKLVGHAWKFDKEGNPLKIVDSSLGDAFDLSEVLRSIHVALLCVQKSPEDRPNMSSVVFMLGNEVEVPQAKQPGFYAENDVFCCSEFMN